jgi:hypothetical protein
LVVRGDVIVAAVSQAAVVVGGEHVRDYVIAGANYPAIFQKSL